MNEVLYDWMKATAWTMEKPKAYGAFHLIFTFVGVLVCILLARRLRRLSDRGNRIVLLSVGIFLVLTEIYKQLFYYYHIGNGHYQWWIFPFQLCSVPMYLCIFASLLKKGNIQSGMYCFMTTYNLLGGIMAFVEPSGIMHEYWTLTLHAFIWHMLLIFVGAYLIASGRFAKTKKEFRSATVVFLVLAAVAFSINLIFWKASNGSINMFFVGPKNSSLAVFKQISQKFGWYVSTLLYIPTVCLGAYLVFLPAYLHNKKKEKKLAMEKKEILCEQVIL